MKTLLLPLAAAVAAAFAGAAGADSVTYENSVKKILAERCLMCHGAGSPTLAEFEKDKEGWAKKFKGPKFDDYQNLIILVNGSDAGALMRRLDDGKSTANGKPGNMYNYLGTNDKERAQRLQTMKQWVGSWSLKRRNDLTNEELAKITAPEK